MRATCEGCGQVFKDDPSAFWFFNDLSDRTEPRSIYIAQCPNCKTVFIEIELGEGRDASTLDTGYLIHDINGWYKKIAEHNPPPPPLEVS